MSDQKIEMWNIRHYLQGRFMGFLHGRPAFENSIRKADPAQIRYYLSSDEAFAVLVSFQRVYPDEFNHCYIERVYTKF